MQYYEYWKLKQIEQSSRYPFTKGQLDYFMLNRHKNGLSKSIRKIGKRLYVRMDFFDKWIESQTSKKEEKHNESL